MTLSDKLLHVCIMYMYTYMCMRVYTCLSSPSGPACLGEPWLIHIPVNCLPEPHLSDRNGGSRNHCYSVAFNKLWDEESHKDKPMMIVSDSQTDSRFSGNFYCFLNPQTKFYNLKQRTPEKWKITIKATCLLKKLILNTIPWVLAIIILNNIIERLCRVLGGLCLKSALTQMTIFYYLCEITL